MEQITAMENGPAVHCNVYEYCTGRHPAEGHCWEIARSTCDFHYVFNVCTDCIVYLYERDNAQVTRKDIRKILQHRQPARHN
ncbi:MAG: hypothetical protein C4563_07950 [Desulfobulbus sp.]|nr:MAG: hypothetical protein C4563_07950 [Desulfobulbus sp.]